MALPPNVQIVAATDREDIRQFQRFKHDVYIKENQVEARASSEPPDLARESYFLAIDTNSNALIGGICVTTLPKNSLEILPFQKMEEFDNWGQLLPNYKLPHYTRSQLSSIAVDIEDPELKRAIKMEPMTRAIDHAFAAKHADVVLTIPQTVIFPESEKKPEPNQASNEVCIRDVIRERALDDPSARHDYAVATKGECHLLSGGKHSAATPPPYARTLYAISSHPKLSRALRRVRDETLRLYDLDSPLHTAGLTEVKTPVSWATRVFPGSGGKPDAVLFDWDSVFTNHVPAYVAAVNAATSHIHAKYGIKPLRTQMRVTDVNTDTKKYIYQLYADNRDIADMDNPDKEKPRESTKLSVKKIATEAYEETKKNLAQYKLEKTAMIPGWQETLRLLKEKDVPYAIVSNGGPESIRNFIEKQMIPEDAALFDGIEIVGNSGKPNPEKINIVLDRMGIPATKNVLFVGDTFNTDVKAALQAGVSPVLFGSRDLTLPDQTGTHMDALRESDELKHLVQKVKRPQRSKERGETIEVEEDEPLEVGFAANHAELQIIVAGVRERFKDPESYRKFLYDLNEFDLGNKPLPPALPRR